MTTKRKQSQATSREGINFFRSLVERNNCMFQEIDPQNDVGNDAYVEFVVDESSTGCCVAVQIKSGQSYRSRTGQFFFQADRDHFEYWASHTLPVLAVIFDPVEKLAAWVDISAHLTANPDCASQGPYSVYAERLLSDETFSDFRDHCLTYRDKYSRELNFGRALESFAARKDVERCIDGMRALFAYHRNQAAAWYYLISCVSNYRGHPVLRPLIVRLSHVPGHGDIFWNQANILDEAARDSAIGLMRECFDRRDALTLLSAIDDAGIDRGTMGQCVQALIDTMDDVPGVMESIAVDQSQTERVRHSAILFAASAAQSGATSAALEMLGRVRATVADGELADVIDWLGGDLRKFGRVSLY